MAVPRVSHLLLVGGGAGVYRGGIPARLSDNEDGIRCGGPFTGGLGQIGRGWRMADVSLHYAAAVLSFTADCRDTGLRTVAWRVWSDADDCREHSE